MPEKKRILVFEFHQETNTFNPIPMTMAQFEAVRHAQGQAMYQRCKNGNDDVKGAIDAIEAHGAQVIPTISLRAGAGGKVADSVMQFMLDRLDAYIDEVGKFDAVCALLHGATCTQTIDDACGHLLVHLRKKIGDIPIAAAFDMHANITDKVLGCVDAVCGFQTYPHSDIYATGYRAGQMCMRLLAGKPLKMATVKLPVLLPPAGYTTKEGTMKAVVDLGHAAVESGQILDFTVFAVQPWLDISNISSTVVVIAEQTDAAKKYAQKLARAFFAGKDKCRPELMQVDQIIDIAEHNTTGKPVILSEASDSPNGGAVGDSVAVALRLLDRGSNLRAAMFVKDPAAVQKAFAVGVGGNAEFTVGAGFTPGAPGPLRAVGTVRSLHDGVFYREGPAQRGMQQNLGLTAVISFGKIDVMVTHEPTATGDPQILRHFGIEPTLYDLVVVKANTSFRLPYSAFADQIYCADTPGAGGSDLKKLVFHNLPNGLFPFDLPSEDCCDDAIIWSDW